MTEDQESPLRREVKRHLAQLGEQFDTVLIIVTKAEADGTIMVQEGSGNWYARYGSMCEVKRDYEKKMVGQEAES